MLERPRGAGHRRHRADDHATHRGGPALGQSIGKYYVVHEVGRGSTGTVYLSHDPFYGRDVAIKVYHATTGDDAESAQVARHMFLCEAQMVGRLQHPNIVPIFDAGEEDGRRYVVTEHVHGARTLSAYCRSGSLLPIDQVCRSSTSAPRRCTTHTRAASCTATSSRPTSC